MQGGGVLREKSSAVDVLFRRLRGAFGNATVWAGGWFAAALAVFATVRILGGFPDTSLAEELETALRFGIVGGIAGAAAAVSLKIAHHAASELPSGTEEAEGRVTALGIDVHPLAVRYAGHGRAGQAVE